ncbi:MAG TPA: sodium:proton antiporter [Thiothrix sp.]|nr:sodium:proton antiporter [Thiothrix sp.]
MTPTQRDKPPLTASFSLLAFLLFTVSLFAFPALAFASGTDTSTGIDLTATHYGIFAVIIFVIAYVLVIGEEYLHLRKSKPMIVAAGLIWVLVALAYQSVGQSEQVHGFLEHNLLEFVELLLFLLAAMTFINTMEERNVFSALRGWLVSKGLSLYMIFWVTGTLAFFISPIADNLTTALLMSAVVIAVAGGREAIFADPQKRNFVAISCINIVVAANAGGAFSPFGDITTLMVWQKGIIEFTDFFVLFTPSLINWLVPASIMCFFISKEQPDALNEKITVKRGGFIVIALFILTIAMAVTFHNWLHLPPTLGMMTGLGLLKLFGYYLKMTGEKARRGTHEHEIGRWDIFTQLQRAEWDTLMFFYGVILCVGGLGALGYLGVVSQLMYNDLGATNANILVGLLSAIVDNIPVMFAVLTMNPEMSQGQWLLVTLTAGVGGSLLSIGSAAGVALMGQARGIYTFMSHLKWTWAIALGYIASIGLHILLTPL